MMIDSVSTQIIFEHQQQPPVDVAALAQRFGLNVYADALNPGISGMIVRRPEYRSASGYSIIVNSSDPLVRQRFTVAHEIAHFLLHRDQIGDGITENTLHRAEGFSSKEEVQANKLAADILMPLDLISRQMNGGNRELRELARTFNVSEIAMAIRLGLQS
ncbi:MAG: ImmA/IrrE family metallo-endopeptidase [Aliidongia sp.]